MKKTPKTRRNITISAQNHQRALRLIEMRDQDENFSSLIEHLIKEEFDRLQRTSAPGSSHSEEFDP